MNIRAIHDGCLGHGSPQHAWMLLGPDLMNIRAIHDGCLGHGSPQHGGYYIPDLMNIILGTHMVGAWVLARPNMDVTWT